VLGGARAEEALRQVYSWIARGGGGSHYMYSREASPQLSRQGRMLHSLQGTGRTLGAIYSRLRQSTIRIETCGSRIMSGNISVRSSPDGSGKRDAGD